MTSSGCEKPVSKPLRRDDCCCSSFGAAAWGNPCQECPLNNTGMPKHFQGFPDNYVIIFALFRVNRSGSQYCKVATFAVIFKTVPRIPLPTFLEIPPPPPRGSLWSFMVEVVAQQVPGI